MKARLLLGAGFLLFAALFVFGYWRAPNRAGDPDRYYHFALSRQMVESGNLVPRAVPQVEDLQWNEVFTDKEFLFHQLTALGYRLGGDSGAEWMAILCSLSALFIFLLFAARLLPAATALGVAFATFVCPFLFTRLQLFRPHTLAIATFLLLLVCVLERRRYATLIAAALFTLSYHAFYLPLAALGLLLPLSLLDPDKKSARDYRALAGFGIAGVIVGLVVNPYFYGNIEIALIHARIPGLIRGELKGLNVGQELFAMSTDVFLHVFHLPIAVLLLACLALGASWQRDRKKLPLKELYLFLLACFFLALSAQTRRAGEYLVPVCGLLGVFLLARLGKKWPGAATALVFLVGLSQSVITLGIYASERVAFEPPEVGNTFAAVNAIPKDPQGAKVYNCEWDRTPYLFYRRPDLRFVDILEPTLLYFANPGAFRARDDLFHGRLADPHSMIRDAAKADYVLCNYPEISFQLAEDPGFQLIHPKNEPTLFPKLFRVKKEDVSEFVRSYRVGALGTYTLETRPDPHATVAMAHAFTDKTTHLDLSRLLAAQGKPGGEGGLRCALVEPDFSELTRHLGATTVILGGGQSFELWRNGKPLYRNKFAILRARATEVGVPLSPPLARSDRLQVRVCSPITAPFWGLTLSLWTPRELEAICAWKREGSGPSNKTAAHEPWAHEGTRRETCLGLLAP